MSRYLMDMLLCCSHSIIWNSLLWTYLVTKEAGKCSSAIGSQEEKKGRFAKELVSLAITS